MDEQAMSLGSFVLEEEVGRDLENLRWRTRHDATGLEATAQLYPHLIIDDGASLAQFFWTAQAQANLDHAGIVDIYDFGTLDHALAGAPSGTPYIVREPAVQSLADIVPLSDWSEVRDVALAILEALAHAHGRNLKHYGLAPGRIAWIDQRLKLGDFELAEPNLAARERVTGESRRVANRARWTAPEQLKRTGDLGPWTDLYGLGCIIYWLLTYHPPYAGPDIDAIVEGHLSAKIPRLKSRIAVPPDFEAWLRRLLAKDPNDRYRFAADAARDLLLFPVELSSAVDLSLADAIFEPAEASPLGDFPDDDVFGDEPMGLEEPSSYAVFETSAMPIRLAPASDFPRSWVGAKPPKRDADREQMRNLPRRQPAGDEDVKDTLWGHLREVDRGDTRCVIVRGPPEGERWTLGEWLLARAAELGAAHTAKARHNDPPQALDGVPGLTARLFRARGLESQQVLGKVRTELSALQFDDQHADAVTLTDLIRAAAPDCPGIDSGDLRERGWRSLARYIAALTRDRPLVILLTDVHRSADTLGFLETVLQLAAGARVLVVATLDESKLPERRVERQRLRRLLSRNDVREVDTPTDAPQQDWGEVVEVFCSDFEEPDSARQAFEVAAILGDDVVPIEWNAVSMVLGLSVPQRLPGAAMRSALLVGRTEGWSFANSALRRYLVRSANTNGRAPQFQHACAVFIGDIYGVRRSNSSRRAAHFIAAGDISAAVDALTDSMELAIARRDSDAVDQLFKKATELAEDTDTPVLSLWIRRARFAIQSGDLDQARDLLDEVEQQLEDANLQDRISFWSVSAAYELARGAFDQALVLADKAVSLGTTAAAAVRAASYRALGNATRAIGARDEAIQAFEQARKLFDEAGDDLSVGWCEYELAAIARDARNPHRHQTHIEAAMAAFEQARHHTALGIAYIECGEGARAQGNFTEALECYADALRYLPEDHPATCSTAVNVGITHIRLENWSIARQWFRRARDELSEDSRPDDETYIELGMIACAAAESRWHEVDSIGDRVLKGLAARKIPLDDAAWLLSKVGDHAAECDARSRARDYWELARKIWNDLSETDRAEQIAAKLEELEG